MVLTSTCPPSSTVSVTIFNSSENLTQNQFQGSLAKTDTLRGASRDSLNPVSNLNRLKSRIAATDAIAARYTPQQLNWHRFYLEKLGRRMWTYKFNHIVKIAFLWRFVSEIRHYRHVNNTTIVPDNDFKVEPILRWGFGSLAVLLLI